ncbi:transcriptional regulator [Agrilactobacillus composti DSM 18527 = JCM 14202]|uniref:Transcriptional regulator n=1 Tax=Agrilactobacillus composti DSM 18527 = JCM 14202 TaxID=1423734 RepID=X0PWM3_9LACO|nr:TetR/AcrR family transcriptional regulator [Agrilactobacillus composti]KRM33374.1 transcriptional regulator [Agrilactobacillus composti DSM 18527 = JCM 14202]GAF41951.1 transcriptional regulator, TetR family [Agrilactobacillus composti DSM 18527 = JCM 14202]
MSSQKPTKETLSHTYILQTALALLDHVGLQKFTMRQLGKQMQVSPMAIYRYFPNQGALFDGLVELIWQKSLAPKPNKIHDDWQAQTIALMSQFRQTLLSHPNILPLISTHPIVTQSEFILVEKFLTYLKSSGLAIQPTTVFLINSLTAYTLGFVWAEAIEPKHGGETDSNVMQALQNQTPLLNELMKPLQDNKFTSDQQFLMGIRAILRGWQ